MEKTNLQKPFTLAMSTMSVVLFNIFIEGANDSIRLSLLEYWASRLSLTYFILIFEHNNTWQAMMNLTNKQGVCVACQLYSPETKVKIFTAQSRYKSNYFYCSSKPHVRKPLAVELQIFWDIWIWWWWLSIDPKLHYPYLAYPRWYFWIAYDKEFDLISQIAALRLRRPGTRLLLPLRPSAWGIPKCKQTGLKNC